jgi:hypothetical protein
MAVRKPFYMHDDCANKYLNIRHADHTSVSS